MLYFWHCVYYNYNCTGNDKYGKKPGLSGVCYSVLNFAVVCGSCMVPALQVMRNTAESSSHQVFEGRVCF